MVVFLFQVCGLKIQKNTVDSITPITSPTICIFDSTSPTTPTQKSSTFRAAHFSPRAPPWLEFSLCAAMPQTTICSSPWLWCLKTTQHNRLGDLQLNVKYLPKSLDLELRAGKTTTVEEITPNCRNFLHFLYFKPNDGQVHYNNSPTWCKLIFKMIPLTKWSSWTKFTPACHAKKIIAWASGVPGIRLCSRFVGSKSALWTNL